MDSNAIKQMARELGFALCGVAEARGTDHRRYVLDWLAAGRHGTMQWLADHAELRLDPASLLPGAQSVICVADHLGAEPQAVSHKSQVMEEPLPLIPCPKGRGEEAAPPQRKGRIARYAQVRDYHVVIKKRLQALADALRREQPEHQFRVCVDTAPVLERELAGRAGLGWVGKNTMLIHPSRGSHLMLGEILTTLALAPDGPEPDHCGSCTRCLEACPTHCIEPYRLDASRCLSYLTIEQREAIGPEFEPLLGDWLYGCDVCQEVCPYNNPQRGEVSDPPIGAYGPPRPATMDLKTLLGWTQEDRRAAFTQSAMKRAKLHQVKRNALLLLMQEEPAEDLLHRVEQIVADEAEHEVVREAARRVLQRWASRGRGRQTRPAISKPVAASR